MTELSHCLPVVLVGGWGVSVAMVEPLLAGWPGPVQTVSLDSSLIQAADSVESLASRILTDAPERALWIGWSQGGQAAMAAGAQAPDRVAGVVTLCSFPRFVASSDWPYGMPEATFAQFADGVAQDPVRYWKRFLTLQVMGDPDERSARQQLRPWIERESPTGPSELSRSLGWLATTDQRKLWRTPGIPALHLWGERDYLVNPLVANTELAGTAESTVVRGMTHWPGVAALTECRAEIDRFVASLPVELAG